jgi:glycogen debranching enzyme
MGFAHYGFKAEVDLVFQGLVGAASRMELRRLPELFCGFHRVRGNGLTRYPVACTPQAWASAAPLALVQASLGIRFDLDQNRISLVGPNLPSFLDMVVLRDVRVADNLVDFAVYRHEQTISIEILRNEGNVEISIVY